MHGCKWFFDKIEKNIPFPLGFALWSSKTHTHQPHTITVDSTPAILLRKTRFSDTSLIITWFTLAHGKLKTIAKGAMNPKSRFAGTLDLFFECEIGFARSAKSELHTLREATLRESREQLRLDYTRVALAAYFVELIEQATELEHPAADLYDLLQRALAHLGQKAASQKALLHFERELARMLGIQNPAVTPIVAIGRAYNRIPSARPSLLKLLPD